MKKTEVKRRLGLLDSVNKNILTHVAPIHLERYCHEVIDDIDYIVGYGDISNPQMFRSHEKNFVIQDVLEIGLFCQSVYKKKYDDVRLNGFNVNRDTYVFKDLINTVLMFTKKYGVWDNSRKDLNLEIKIKHMNRDFPMNEPIVQQELSVLIENALLMIEFLDFIEKRNASPNSSYLMERRLFDMYSKIHFSLAEDDYGVISFSYDFDNIIEIAKFQLLYSVGTRANELRRCPYCNIFFEAKGKQVYCCKEHRISSYKGRKYNFTKKCENCGELFIVKHQNEKYCSIKCKKRAEYMRLTKTSVLYDPEGMTDLEIEWLKYKELFLEDPK